MPISIGPVPVDKMNARQYAEFLRVSGIQGDRSPRTFTPTWSGFSAAPTGSINYMNFGAFVFMWADADLTGTSNGGALKITNLPAGATPKIALKVRCVVVDDGLQRGGAAEPDVAGDIDFYLDTPNTVDVRVDLAAASFKASGTKGLKAGWMIVYPVK